MNDNLSNQQFGRYTVVTYHEDKNGNPRAKARGSYEYDEEATEAGKKIAESDGTILPNVAHPEKHPKYGEYSRGVFQHGNKMGVVYLRGEARYRGED